MSAARLRFPRWPLHPAAFLVWGTGHAHQLAVSLLLGGVIKALVTRYGGMNLYHRLKPMMFGLIAGDMLGGIVVSLVGTAYYRWTGTTPVRFPIMAG